MNSGVVRRCAIKDLETGINAILAIGEAKAPGILRLGDELLPNLTKLLEVANVGGENAVSEFLDNLPDAEVKAVRNVCRNHVLNGCHACVFANVNCCHAFAPNITSVLPLCLNEDLERLL